MRLHLLAGTAVLTVFGLPALAVAADAAPAAPPSDSQAAQAAGDQGNSVVVTARKRAERVLDIPIPITAVSGAQIRQLDIKDFEQIISLIPSATVQESGFGIYRDVFIRGVGTPGLLVESGVAINNDGVFSGGIITNPTQYYDLDRVEVLRGPQGGLYGRDATGGAINIYSARPTDTYSAFIEGTYARYDNAQVTATVNAPINQYLAVRVTGWDTNQSQGEYYNSYLHEYVDANSSDGGRIVAVAKPTSNLELTLIAETATNKGPENYYFIPAAGETPTTIQRNTASRLTLTNTRITPQVKYESSLGTFVAIGGYSDYQLHSFSDQDFTASPVDPQIIRRHDHFDNYFSEFRWISPVDRPVHWIVGGNYLSSTGSSDLAVDLYPALGTPSAGTFARVNGQEFHSYDVFGEGYYDPTPKLEFAANVRYTDDTKTLDYLQTATGALAFIGGYPANAVRDFTNVSPGGSITYKPNHNLSLYAKVQTGFRSGGFNFIASQPQDIAYNPETSISYELGAKSQFWDGRVSLNADIYKFDQNNVLVAESDPSGNNFDFLKNVGKATTYGFELDGSLQVTHELLVTGSLSIMDPQLTYGVENAGTASALVLTGNQLPYAPRRTIGVTFDYRHPIFGGAATLVADGSFSDRFDTWQDIENTEVAPDYDIANLRLGVEYKRYSITGFANNVTNKRYIVSEAFAGPGEGFELSPGLTYGVTFRAHY